MKPGRTEAPAASTTRVAGLHRAMTSAALPTATIRLPRMRHGLGVRSARVHGQDAGVGDDEVGGHFCSSVQMRVMIWLTSGGQFLENKPLLPSGSVSSGAPCMSAGMYCSLPAIPFE